MTPPESLVALADAQAVPDFEAGAGVRHLSSSNDSALVAEVVVPIPLFDRNQGERAAGLFVTARVEVARDDVPVAVVDTALQAIDDERGALGPRRGRALRLARRALLELRLDPKAAC